jgi:Mg2+-importing ATPase
VSAPHVTADGLSDEQVARLRQQFGRNEIAAEKPSAWPVRLLLAFHAPFNYLLAGVAAISALTGEGRTAAVVGGMVVLSSLLRFVQEFRSGRAAETLRAMVHTRATVVRGGKTEDVPMAELVPGDVVLLSAGDLVPADLQLAAATDLFVSQATLTGESMPVEKHPPNGAADDATAPPAECPTRCLLGSSVVSGSGRGVVTATGGRTHLGSLAHQLIGVRAVTAFDKGVNAAGGMLIRFMLVMVPVIVLVNGLTKGDWPQAVMFGLSVAVGLTPEMLPMIVTANLARGAVALSRRKVIVKRLPAIQNLGSMDVLCTDKTGTLTQDKVVLIRHLDPAGGESGRVLEYAVLNSHFQTGLKSLLDHAVLAAESQPHLQELLGRYAKLDEVPFDFQRRRMSVVTEEPASGDHLLICKGAVEEVLSACSAVRLAGGDEPLADAHRAGARARADDLNADGLRVIAVAVKRVEDPTGRHYGIADERELTLVGFIAFLDPPKESAAPALAALAGMGVAVKILTGDSERVARKVCRDVGLPDPPTLLGPKVDVLSNAELEVEAERAVLFARLSPPQKARLVAALKRRGHTVGFLGDGINDAAALREADVGVSVDTAADVAREAADVILLEKSLLVLGEGVTLGRQTFANTVKYLKMVASSNFGNVLSVLVASVWLPFLPMLAIQLVLQNLLYDFSQAGIPFDRSDPEELTRPRSWRVADLGRFMLCVGPVSSLFDLATFAVLWFGFGADTPERQALFQSGWFVEGLLTQTLVIHVLRTAKVPFVQSVPAPLLLWLTGVIAAVGLSLPYLPIGSVFGLVPLPARYLGWLAVACVGYGVAAQGVKRWYIRRYGGWL